MAASFSTDQERKKWQSLQNQAGQSLQNIVRGNASSSDFQRVTTALNQLNSLAATTFAHAISAAEVQAKKFESAYAGALVERDSKTLTAFEAALNDALKVVEPNIVGALQEIILNSSIETAEEVDRTVGGRIRDLASMFPQDVASTTDLLTSNDLLVEELGKQDDVKWERREASLIEKIADVFQSTLRNLADSINRERAARNAPTAPPRSGTPLLSHSGGSGGALVPMHGFGGGNPDFIDMEAHPALPGAPLLLDRAMPLLGGPQGQAPAISQASQSGGTGTVVVSLSAKAEGKLIDAADAQTALYQKLLDFLQGQGAGEKEKGQAEEEADEEEKADTWWRSFKNWYGSKIDDYKKFKKENGGWLKALGSALMLLVFNPQLFKTFGEAVKKWVTFDNIKTAVSAAWDWAADKASNMVDTVLDKLGIGKIDQQKVTESKDGGTNLATTAPKAGHADLKNLTPEQKKKLAEMDAKSGSGIDKNPNAKLPDNPSAGGHSSWQSKVANLFGITLGRESVVNSNLAHTDTNVNSPTYGKTIVNGQVINGGKSTIDNSQYNIKPGTSVNSADGVSMTPGSMNPPPGTTGPELAPGTGDNRAARGAPQTGMSTFSFHTGLDDALMMSNTPYFTG